MVKMGRDFFGPGFVTELCQHHAGEDRKDRSADDRDLFAQQPARQSDRKTKGNSR